MGAVVTKGGLIFVGGGDTVFYALDTADGREVWTFQVGRRTTATPMTYQIAGKQFVVIASGTGKDATLTAFSL
jgi:glucose dehydrogenase